MYRLSSYLKYFLFSVLALALGSCSNWKRKDPAATTALSRYVDPFIGTGGHGHTFPGATLPFGMVQLSPDTRIDGSWDGCSGFHYSDTVIYGFSHTHLNGTGCSDYGDILLMPTVGEPSLDNSLYSSHFSHEREKASAGYYSVKLDKGDIQVELTATLRAGFHKYIFPKAGTGNVVIDLHHRDKTLESRLEVLDKTHLEGMRRSEAWAKDQHIYFSLQFSRPFKTSILLADAKEGETNAGQDRGGVFTFDTKAGDSILVKIGLSTVSMEGARKNLQSEIPGWDFQQVRADAAEAWNQELGKIEVTSPETDKLRIFYTALYHTMIQPNLNMDVDSMYRGRDNKVHKAKDFTYYSVFSLWDTFRGAHPLYTIIEQKRTVDFIKTFLAEYKEGGRLPVWELASNETDCMIGYPAVPVIADAAMKGINGFDMNLALEAMEKSANWKHFGLPAYINHGYLAVDDESESVSKTLEYAYDDWCISCMASLLGKEKERLRYLKRSQNYRNVFDKETGFMRPRKNGCWLERFDPTEVSNNYTEANAWQYSFFVPQDFPRYIEMLGGKEKFGIKLDSLFGAKEKTSGREQADITGLIGQYAHGNEPSHHIAYLYNYAGEPWKTQEIIHRILTQFYKAAPDGLIGNEDCGQMSAWYVLSSMGFYSVTPGSPAYSIGAPLFNQVRIHLENGKTFTIQAKEVSDKNKYVQNVGNTHAPFDPLILSHQDIMNGETLHFDMVAEPNYALAGKSTCSPLAGAGNNTGFIAAPVFESTSLLFRNSAEVSILPNEKGSQLYYTTDGKNPDRKSKKYAGSFKIEKTTTLKAVAYSNTDSSIHSGIASGTFHKFPHWWTINIKSNADPLYAEGGEETLIDGIRGDLNWKKGNWLGYQGQDFEAVIDLGQALEITKLGAGFLQDANSWIMMPREVNFFLSSDGKKFKHIVTIEHSVSETDQQIQIKELTSAIRKQKARYVKIHATNFGRMPEINKGARGNAYIFVDEIEIQ
jgi:predicted alpha-1,2-mannosidase